MIFPNTENVLFIHNQHELDAIDADADVWYCVRFGTRICPAQIRKPTTNPVLIDKDYFAEASNYAYVIARGRSTVVGLEFCAIEVWSSNATAETRGQRCTLVARKSAQVVARSDTTVYLYDNARCEAYDRCDVYMSDAATVHAHDNVVVRATGGSCAYVHDEVKTHLTDKSKCCVGRESLGKVKIVCTRKPAKTSYVNFKKIGNKRLICAVEM